MHRPCQISSSERKRCSVSALSSSASSLGPVHAAVGGWEPVCAAVASGSLCGSVLVDPNSALLQSEQDKRPDSRSSVKVSQQKRPVCCPTPRAVSLYCSPHSVRQVCGSLCLVPVSHQMGPALRTCLVQRQLTCAETQCTTCRYEGSLRPDKERLLTSNPTHLSHQ